MTTNDYIPELDLSEWFEGDAESKASLAKKWDAAFRTSGFCTVVNHGFPDDVLGDMYARTKEFFDLDLAEKLRFKSESFLGPGFHQAGEENFDAKNKNGYDLNDSWQFYSSPESVDAFIPTGDNAYAPLYEEATKYWRCARALQAVLFEISDQALGLEKGTFARFHFDHGTPMAALRLSDYFAPSSDRRAVGTSRRLGGHTDYLCYTILKCDEVPGLEVAVGEIDFDQKDLSPFFDTWVKVTPRPGALVINAGDMLRFWTNGIWKSSFHRVVMNPKRRISLVFFTGPGYGATTAARFPGFASDKFLQMKMTLPQYFQFRKDMASTA
jgi:isopenicillin N synthase-like dioxygenase